MSLPDFCLAVAWLAIFDDHATSRYLHMSPRILKALSSCVKTDMNMKSRSFQVQGWVLVAIEASNLIYRALEAQKEALGLLKVLAPLNHEVKQMMDNVQTLLVDLMRHTQKSPSRAAVYFGPLKAGLKKGIPSYLNPDGKVVEKASSKHPLVTSTSSKWKTCKGCLSCCAMNRNGPESERCQTGDSPITQSQPA